MHRNSFQITTGNISLLKNILKRKWKTVRSILITPQGIKQVRDEYNKGLTILSIAVSFNPPVDILALILKIEPLHSLKVDTYGVLPLHVACMHGASLDVIKLLLDHDDCACAQAIDMKKKSPLHYAVQYVCQPHRSEIGNRFSSGTSGEASLEASLRSQRSQRSQRSFLSFRSGRRSSRGRNDEGSSTLSMSQDRFQEQMKIIKILTDAAPEIVLFGDVYENTPVDILQDCKAEYRGGSKWERADICCEILRKIAINQYREQKKVSEMQGHSYTIFPNFNTSNASSSNGSNLSSNNTGVSGTSNLSKMEIDCSSYDRMDLSSNGDDFTTPKGWSCDRVPAKGEIISEELDIAMVEE